MKRKKVLVIGGGSGASSVLEGLGAYDIELTTMCTPFDNGGHSGEVRDVHGVLPPGDARRHLTALAPEGASAFLRKMFLWRFPANNKSLGNYMMAGATGVAGSDQAGIDELVNLLNVRAQILYATADKAHLCAELDDGEIIEGEEKIDLRPASDRRGIQRVFLKPQAHIALRVANAIREAHLIVLSPGDLYGSVIANTLVTGFQEAIHASGAKTLYVMNLVTRPNETRGFTASQFAKTLLQYIGLPQFDTILFNTGEIPQLLRERYEAEEAFPVVVDGSLSQYARQLIGRNFLHPCTEVLRHSSTALGQAIMEVLNAS